MTHALRLAALLALAVVLAASYGQVSLVPVDPARTVSPEHQVRQDDAIQALAGIVEEHAKEDDRRLARLEKIVDGILLAILGLGLTQLYATRRDAPTREGVQEVVGYVRRQPPHHDPRVAPRG